MTGELKHYDGEEKPWGLFVNGEYIGSYYTIQEAANAYDRMLKGEKSK